MDAITTATTTTTTTTHTEAPGFDLPDCRLCRHYSPSGCGSLTVCSLGSNFVPASPVRFYPLQPLAGSQKT